MRIALNLATRPFADLGPTLKRLRIAMAVLALVAAGLGYGLHALHHKAEMARARAHSLDGALAQVTHEREGYQALMHEPANAELLNQVDTLNKLFDEKAFSWTLAMESLETVLPGGVQVTAIEPVRAKDGHITLHLRVSGPRDKAVDLVKNLEGSRRFLLPRIVGENAETTNLPGQRLQPVSASSNVNFDLLAEYNPPTPAENKTPAGKPARTEKSTGQRQSEEPARRATAARRPLRQPSTGQRHAVLPKPKPKPRAGQAPHPTAGGAR